MKTLFFLLFFISTLHAAEPPIIRPALPDQVYARGSHQFTIELPPNEELVEVYLDRTNLSANPNAIIHISIKGACSASARTKGGIALKEDKSTSTRSMVWCRTKPSPNTRTLVGTITVDAPSVRTKVDTRTAR